MLFFLILGLLFGSFLNVLIHRIPKDENFLSNRSYCDYCKKVLSWYDLVPLLSFLILKGRCRFCKEKINPQIPVVELVTGVLFASYFLKHQTADLNLFLGLLILSGLIVIFFTDAVNEIIPDKILFPLFLIAILLNYNSGLLTYLLTGILSFIFFFLLYFLSKGKAMGFGDVKFAGVLGLILGFPTAIVSFYLSFLTGGITSLILVLWGKKKFKKDTIPFGPFLSLGAIVSLFLGDLLVSRLLSFLQ